MPFYRFIIHGQGIVYGPRPGKRGGFYTTRWAFAATQEQAARKALEAVRQDWTHGPSSTLSPGRPPTSLNIDKGWRIGIHQLWGAPNKGNTLYPDEENE